MSRLELPGLLQPVLHQTGPDGRCVTCGQAFGPYAPLSLIPAPDDTSDPYAVDEAPVNGKWCGLC